MSAHANKMFVYQCANPALDWNSTLVGGAKTSVKISGSVIGESFFMMYASGSGGTDKVQHAKQFIQNDNAETAYQVQVWIENGGTDLPAPGYPRATPLGAQDSTTTIRYLGFDLLGNPLQSDKTFNGVGVPRTANDGFNNLHRAILVSTETGALVLAEDDILIDLNGTAVGKIPKGLSCMTCEYDIGLESAQNGSTTIATPATPPSGVTLSRPISGLSPLSVVGGSVVAGSAVPMWIRWLLKPLARATADIIYSTAIRVLGA